MMTSKTTFRIECFGAHYSKPKWHGPNIDAEEFCMIPRGTGMGGRGEYATFEEANEAIQKYSDYWIEKKGDVTYTDWRIIQHIEIENIEDTFRVL